VKCSESQNQRSLSDVDSDAKNELLSLPMLSKPDVKPAGKGTSPWQCLFDQKYRKNCNLVKNKYNFIYFHIFLNVMQSCDAKLNFYMPYL